MKTNYWKVSSIILMFVFISLFTVNLILENNTNKINKVGTFEINNADFNNVIKLINNKGFISTRICNLENNECISINKLN